VWRSWRAIPLLLAVGCGESQPPARATATPTPTATAAAAKPPALCGKLRARVVGRVTAEAAQELSGLAMSRSGVFWAHNDSGDGPRVLALRRDGSLIREVELTGAAAVDWEDIATRGRTVYVGDIGDNGAERPGVVVYRFTEPPGEARSVVPVATALRYADGPRDAEALLVDPRGGGIHVVTKDFSGTAGLYRADGDTLRRVRTLQLGLGAAVTAGDVSADGRVIVLRGYAQAFVWTRRSGESIARALRREPCVATADLTREGQGEALALSRDGRVFWTVPEGPRPALRRYGP
jgi:hypothetical protein